MAKGKTGVPTRVLIRHPIPNNFSINIWVETWNGSTWVRRGQADYLTFQDSEIERSVTANVQRLVIEEGT